MKGSDNPYPSLLFEEHVDPSNPSAGTQRLFVDTDHILKLIDSAGNVTQCSGALSNPMTTAGDLIVGGASGSPGRLAIGAAGTFLKSDGSAAAWAALTTAENFLTGAVTMTSANTFYDGPSLTLAVGTYLLLGHVVLLASSGGYFTGKLWDGSSSILDANDVYEPTNGGTKNMSFVGFVVVASGTPTYKISVALNATGGTIVQTPGANATGLSNKTSHLVSIKIA